MIDSKKLTDKQKIELLDLLVKLKPHLVGRLIIALNDQEANTKIKK